MNLSLAFSDIQDCNGVPDLEIRVNGSVMYQGPVISNIRLESEIGLGDIQLEIEHRNKDYLRDTLVSGDKIVKDKSCNLESITVDGYDLQELKWLSSFTTDQRQIIDKCLFFGPNGTWRMQFSLPVLPWILQQRHDALGNDPHWLEDYQYYLRACQILQTLN